MNQSENDKDDLTITLTLDNNEVLECSILTVYEAAGKQYIALLPLDDQPGVSDGDVYLYRFREQEDEPILENIEDDEEYEIASDGFEEWLDTVEFEGLIEEDEPDADDDDLK